MADNCSRPFLNPPCSAPPPCSNDRDVSSWKLPSSHSMLSPLSLITSILLKSNLKKKNSRVHALTEHTHPQWRPPFARQGQGALITHQLARLAQQSDTVELNQFRLLICLWLSLAKYVGKQPSASPRRRGRGKANSLPADGGPEETLLE